MDKKIEKILTNAGYDIQGLLSDKLYSDFRLEYGCVRYEYDKYDKSTGYSVEVRPDGKQRYCGYGKGCFWTDWE